MTDELDDLDPVEIPIDGTLDLHTFSPREIKELVVDYLQECRERGILQVRIVHGKGTGTLRLLVRRELGKHSLVHSFRPGIPAEGSQGVTIVELAER